MEQHFREILLLYNRKNDELNKNKRFKDVIKWISVVEYGFYLYKKSQLNILFKEKKIAGQRA